MNYLVVFLAITIGLLVACVSTRKALTLAIFFLPWQELSVEVGVSVTFFLALWLPLCLVALAGCKGRSIDLNTYGALFIAWAIVSTFVHIPYLPEVQVAGGQFRTGPMRSVSQILMFAISVSPVVVVPLLVRTPEQTYGLLYTYLTSCVVLCLLAWVQVLVFAATGQDPFPISIVRSYIGADTAAHTLVAGSAFEKLSGVVFFRPTSFGGEPKWFGMSLVVGLIFIQTLLPLQAGLMRRKLKVAWCLLFCTMVLTLSSTAFIVFVLYNLVLMYVQYGTKRLRGHRYSRTAQLVLVVTLCILGYATMQNGSYDGNNSYVLGILYDRTFARVIDEGRDRTYYHEDHDGPVMDFLIDDPLSAVTGVGLGNAHFYTHQYSLDRNQGEYCHVAKRGYLRQVSEVGMIGLGLLFMWIWRAGESMKRRMLVKDPGLWATAIALVRSLWLVTFAYLLAGQPQVFTLIFILVGMTVALSQASSAIPYGRNSGKLAPAY